MSASPSAEKQHLGASHLPVLERYGGRRGKQAVAAIAAAQMLAPAAQWAYNRLLRREVFTVTVAGTDEIYPDLHDWMLERIPENRRTALIARTVLQRVDHHNEVASLELRYDGTRQQEVTIDGHKVLVAVSREDFPGKSDLPDNWRQQSESMLFHARSPEGRDAVITMIDGLLETKHGALRSPALYVPARWGGEWTRRGDLPPRTLDSIVLKRGQLEGLVADLQTFLADEDWYGQLSQPWHRGYLFHGSPGTGKTSVARALANHFGLPTYYLPLGDLERDANLIGLVAQILPRSVLLIEDADVFSATTEREDEKGRASLAGMLNALDGVWTPHGLITILTTNSREDLDGALIRPGRIDVEEEFSTLDGDQAQRLVELFEIGMDPKPFVGRGPSVLLEEMRRQHA